MSSEILDEMLDITSQSSWTTKRRREERKGEEGPGEGGKGQGRPTGDRGSAFAEGRRTRLSDDVLSDARHSPHVQRGLSRLLEIPFAPISRGR